MFVGGCALFSFSFDEGEMLLIEDHKISCGFFVNELGNRIVFSSIFCNLKIFI